MCEFKTGPHILHDILPHITAACVNLKQDLTVHVQRRSCVCFDFNFLLASSILRLQGLASPFSLLHACLRYVRAFNGGVGAGPGGGAGVLGAPVVRGVGGLRAAPRAREQCPRLREVLHSLAHEQECKIVKSSQVYT